MNIAVLGTVVGSDTLKVIKKSNWKLVCNLVSFSPFAIVENNQLAHKINDLSIFENENPVLRQSMLADLNGDLIATIKKSNPDLILMDLGDFRIGANMITLASGENVFFSNKKYSDNTYKNIYAAIEREYNSSIVKKSIIGVSNITEEELKSYIKRFISIINSECGGSKVLVIESRLITHCIIDGALQLTPNFTISGNTNKLLARVYNAYGAFGKYVRAPNNLIGDSSCLTPFEYHYCYPYYKYLENAIEDFMDDKSFEHLYQICVEEINRMIHDIMATQILSKMKPNGNQPIILIADDMLFNEKLKEKYGKEVDRFIKRSTIQNEQQAINMCKVACKGLINPIFIIMCLPVSADDICFEKIMMSLDKQINKGYYLYKPMNVVLNDIGTYCDIFGNNINLETKVIVHLYGAIGTEIKMGKGAITKFIVNVFGNMAKMNVGAELKGNNVYITLSTGSNISIGEKTTFAGYDFDNKTDIRAHIFTTIQIGKDCMFSYNAVLYSGDGHSIFSIIDAEKRIYKKINDSLQRDVNIVIGEHCWIGYGVKILSGTHIGNGSIIGAASLVKGKFPNNCALGGNPAKILKLNVAWSRNVLIQELEDDINVMNTYANTSNCNIIGEIKNGE